MKLKQYFFFLLNTIQPNFRVLKTGYSKYTNDETKTVVFFFFFVCKYVGNFATLHFRWQLCGLIEEVNEAPFLCLAGLSPTSSEQIKSQISAIFSIFRSIFCRRPASPSLTSITVKNNAKVRGVARKILPHQLRARLGTAYQK